MFGVIPLLYNIMPCAIGEIIGGRFLSPPPPIDQTPRPRPKSGTRRGDRAGGGQVRPFFSRFWIAQTSGRVYPEQNLTTMKILRSVCLQLLRNLAKIAKKQIFNPNFSSKKTFQRRKMKRWESFETRFLKVWRVCEPCSRGKRPFEVS